MRELVFRQWQVDHRMDPHIAPINKLVAELKNREGRGWLPEVAPVHGGVNARVLSVLRDPGPKTQEGKGSGFLCIENDDPTAEAQCALFEEHGIAPGWVLPWNAYPWYIDRAPRAAEKDAGAGVLCEVIDLVPTLQAVFLQGNDAIDVWKRVLRLRPAVVHERNLEVIESIHPGRQALWTSDPAERAARKDKQRNAFQHLVAALGNPVSG